MTTTLRVCPSCDTIFRPSGSPLCPRCQGGSAVAFLTLTCRHCRWQGMGRPVSVVANALRHAQETGHEIDYRGYPAIRGVERPAEGGASR